MKTVINVPMTFDQIRFGIDVKDARLSFGWTQDQLASAVGYKNGVSISAIEVARDPEGISVRRYMSLCNVCHLNPMHYWECVPDAYEPQDGWERQDHA